MQFAFDLISDLHAETWDSFDWTGQPTSPIAVIAGDIARDRKRVIEILTHLGQCYQAVFYIDGNEEHKNYRDDITTSYQNLVRQLANIPNVVYLQDNVVVIDGVAILGTNGWFGFDFDPAIDATEVMAWCHETYHTPMDAVLRIQNYAVNDAAYMVKSIKRLQTHQDIRRIVVVSHTVPDPQLIAHDLELAGTFKFNVMGNRYMMQALGVDTENKIHTWCFGHYHGSVDQIHSGVRFVNNCRGRGDTHWKQHVYHPRRIVVDV